MPGGERFKASVYFPVAADYTDETFGLPTVTDIIAELDKPGRAPRPEFKTAKFKEGIENLSDLVVSQTFVGIPWLAGAASPPRCDTAVVPEFDLSPVEGTRVGQPLDSTRLDLTHRRGGLTPDRTARIHVARAARILGRCPINRFPP